MPPHVKSRWVPKLKGLKFFTNAWSPEPAATTQGWLLALELDGAATADAPMTVTKSAAAITAVKVRFRTDELFMSAALTPSLPAVDRVDALCGLPRLPRPRRSR